MPTENAPPELPPTPAKSAHNWINKALETSKNHPYPEEQRSYRRGYIFDGQGGTCSLLVEEDGDGRVLLRISSITDPDHDRKIILTPEQWRELRGLYLNGG